MTYWIPLESPNVKNFVVTQPSSLDEKSLIQGPTLPKFCLVPLDIGRRETTIAARRSLKIRMVREPTVVPATALPGRSPQSIGNVR